MSRLGNVLGPSKDDILASIPLSEFGCEPREVEIDIKMERFSTINGGVEPVPIDREGRPFCSFCAAGGGSFRHYLDEELSGDILVDVNARVYGFTVEGRQEQRGKYRAVLSDGNCEISRVADGHLVVTKGELPQGIGIAEQVALHQWRLKVPPTTAESPTPEVV